MLWWAVLTAARWPKLDQQKSSLARRRVSLKLHHEQTYGSVSPPTSSWETPLRVSIQEA